VVKQALIVLVAAAAACRGREAPAAAAAASTPTAASAPATAPAPASAAPAPDKLIGRWLRADANYTIEIAGVGADGKLDARYLNPQPIHVSRAEAKTVDGKLLLGIELQDRNYPGNFYALVYDPGSDSLSGVYNHLGLNQQFEVAFSRVSPAP
jgi:uncharacterized protein (DUF2147 family)